MIRAATSLALMGFCSAAIAAAPVAAQEAKTSIMPENPEALAFQNAVGYADAVISGNMVHLAGVVATPEPGETDMKLAYARAFDQISNTLARAGASWDDVVDLSTFHTDLAGQINEFADVKNRYIKAPFPAWTAIGISALYEPTGLVEIKVTAQRPDQ